jgi:hypothetical protein
LSCLQFFAGYAFKYLYNILAKIYCLVRGTQDSVSLIA